MNRTSLSIGIPMTNSQYFPHVNRRGGELARPGVTGTKFLSEKTLEPFSEKSVIRRTPRPQRVRVRRHAVARLLLPDESGELR